MSITRNLLLIYAAAFLRSLGVGLTGVILGIYLSRAGFSATSIGVVIATGMAGTALGTLVVSFRADRLGRRRTLIALSLLMSLGGLGLALTTNLGGDSTAGFSGNAQRDGARPRRRRRTRAGHHSGDDHGRAAHLGAGLVQPSA